jgi:heme A synthase
VTGLTAGAIAGIVVAAVVAAAVVSGAAAGAAYTAFPEDDTVTQTNPFFEGSGMSGTSAVFTDGA